MTERYDIVILGLSITSSWGNGHATTYRSLARGLAARGHRILFLERNTEWYAGNRDEPHPEGARTEIYEDFAELPARYERHVSQARLVIVGSFVPEGTRVGDWVLSVARGVTDCRRKPWRRSASCGWASGRGSPFRISKIGRTGNASTLFAAERARRAVSS